MKLDSNYISSLSKRRKHALFENVTLDNRAAYHAVSERPLTKQGDSYTVHVAACSVF